VFVAALAVTLLARAPKGPPPSATTAAPAASTAISLEIGDRGLTPGLVRVNKGDRIALKVHNAGASRVEIALPGYEDRLPAVTIEPGETWTGELQADRPGEDFAWMVNGKPAGRLVVAGSHLVEGHQ
jgi:hypothetical protein